MPDSPKPDDAGSRSDERREPPTPPPSKRERSKPVLDVESEQRDFEGGSDIHVW